MKLIMYSSKYLDLQQLEQQNLYINLEYSFTVLNPFMELIDFRRIEDSKQINIMLRTFTNAKN